MAALVRVVAVERVRDEMNRILVEGIRGVRLLSETGLLAEILPEVAYTEELRHRFERASDLSTTVAWAALLLDTGNAAVDILKRLRFSTSDLDALRNVIASRAAMRSIESLAMPAKKRLMRDPQFPDYVTLHQLCGDAPPVLPRYTDEELHPARLLSGLDLIELGYPQGPLYSRILSTLEDAQLEGSVQTREEALRWLRARF
jgi:poly(A) polymerase